MFFNYCVEEFVFWSLLLKKTNLGLDNMTFTNFFSVLMASESSWVHSYQMHDLWLMYSLEDKFPFFKSDGKKTFQAAKTEKCGRFILLLSSVASSFSLSIICSLLSLCKFFLCGFSFCRFFLCVGSFFVDLRYLCLFFIWDCFSLCIFFLCFSCLRFSTSLMISLSVGFLHPACFVTLLFLILY